MTEALPLRLIALADPARDPTEAAFVDRALRLVDVALQARSAGLGAAVQLRLKALPRRDRTALAARLLRARPDAPWLLGLPDDEAAPLEPWGLHWPEVAIPEDPPARWHPRGPITASVHTLAAARRAHRAGAHRVLFAPVWSPRSKTAEATGTTALRALARTSPVGVIALGGVRPDRVVQALACGAVGVASLGGLDDPEAGRALSRLAEALRVAIDTPRDGHVASTGPRG